MSPLDMGLGVCLPSDLQPFSYKKGENGSILNSDWVNIIWPFGDDERVDKCVCDPRVTED